MPELPEVETVRRSLALALGLGTDNTGQGAGPQTGLSLAELPQLQGWHFARQDLRYPLPIARLRALEGSRLLAVERRSKYLLLYWVNPFVGMESITLLDILQNISTRGAQLQLSRLVVHLGMTGVLKVLNELSNNLQDESPSTCSGPACKLDKHDHLWACLQILGQVQAQQKYLLYNDVRRFGFWAHQEFSQLIQNAPPNCRKNLFKADQARTTGQTGNPAASWHKLGPEPLPLERYRQQAPITLALCAASNLASRVTQVATPATIALSGEHLGEHLYQCSRKVSRELKPWLLDGKAVCGVGNIYCCESLWLAGLCPRKLTGKLSRSQAARLAKAIVQTVAAAIAAGGTTLRDFRSALGKPGYFQLELRVYGREGQPCSRCTSARIAKIVQAQRATYYCPQCQN